MAGVTIKEVALHAGVSQKTVSRVVNREAAVRSSTRARVLASIQALGYSPNQAARGLAANRSYCLCLLYDNPSAAYVMALQEGVLNVCEKEGFSLLIRSCALDSEQLIEETERLMARQHPDGFILTPPLSDSRQLIAALESAGVPFVRISPQTIERASDARGNEIDGVKSLIQHLIVLGHSDIGIILGHPAHGSTHARLEGFKRAMQEADLKINADWIGQGDFSFDSGVRSARQMLQLKQRPTAIFASNDYMAAGVMTMAAQMGLSIPGDLSVAGFDDAPVASQLWPPLTTIRQPISEIARLATRYLLAAISNRDNEADNSPQPLQCQLVVRGTTGIAAKQSIA